MDGTHSSAAGLIKTRRLILLQVRGNSCLTAFIWNWFFPAFEFQLKHWFFLGFKLADLWLEVIPSALLDLQLADCRSWNLPASLLWVYIHICMCIYIYIYIYIVFLWRTLSNSILFIFFLFSCLLYFLFTKSFVKIKRIKHWWKKYSYRIGCWDKVI